MTEYPRGAEWRKWDLHVHTPGTAKNDLYKSAGSDVWEEFIQKLKDTPDIVAIGVTDYFSIDNYLKVKEEQNKGKLKGRLILPNIELRILPVTGKSIPINVHVIFDPQIGKDTIEREFLRDLKFEYKDSTYACLRSDLIKLGIEYTKKPQLPDDEAWKAGIGQFNIPFDKLKNVLNKKVLHGKFLVGVPNGSNDGNSGIQHSSLAATRSEIYRLADFIFSGNPNDITHFLGKDQNGPKPEEIISEYGSLKPCFTGSDAHSFDKLFQFTTNRELWLKADPTFKGLKQVIKEPEARVFVGEKPHLKDKVANNRTKYIERLSIDKVSGYHGKQGTWFQNVTIPINQELVAIIGNKGSGKSAIADIISLCANHSDSKDFSFLTSQKFREGAGRIAKNFEATLTWESDVSDKKNLNDSVEPTELLKVKYIPQGRFEQLTNEISTARKFRAEIESVVFSHIPESERHGTSSFNELIQKKSRTADAAISTLKGDINAINKEIIGLEEKSVPSYRTELANKIKRKQEELDALVEPEEISDPNEDPDKKKQNQEINESIGRIKDEIEKIENKIREATIQKKNAFDSIQTLETVKSEVQQKQTEVERLKESWKDMLLELGIDVKKLISFNTDVSEIDALISSTETKLAGIRSLLGEGEVESEKKTLPAQLEEKQNALKLETAKLNTEQKLYQDYLAARANWGKEKARITGSVAQPDTLKLYEAEMDYLDKELEKILESKYKERRSIVRDIFDKKQEVIDFYKSTRDRLEEIIQANSDVLQKYRIYVDASLVAEIKFAENFLDQINKGKVGTFYSIDGGAYQFELLSSETNFDKKEDIIDFLDKLISHLKEDKREHQNDAPRVIADQVKNVLELYDYLFSLDFLENNYQLKQGDKNLEQLSPGERGALLLVFYLLLDKSNIPLIIDQPEDNLDNHSVATILVPFIKAAKERRQIIMVTHNPNLAVVADAEQIVYVNLDKENKNKFLVESGSIEDEGINKRIVEVLEGAMPAFNNRKTKYYDQAN